MASPILWGPSNTSNSLQSGVILSPGQFLNAQGAKNYIKYGHFENNATTGWALFNTTRDATTKFPNQASSGWAVATGTVSFTTSSSDPLSDQFSALFACSAATNAGDMLVSNAFDIDGYAQGNVLAFSFKYEFTAGASNCNLSGTNSNSFGIGIYDVTNNTWIMPAGVFNIVQGSGAGLANGTFQVPITTSQLRIAIYYPNATTGSYTMKVDDFFVGPQVTSVAPAMSDPVAYTPVFTGFGTVSGVNVKSWRVGKYLFLEGIFTTGTATAVEARMTLGYNGVSGNVVADSTLPTLSLAGKMNRTSGSGAGFFSGETVLCEPNVNYVTFGTESSTVSGMVKGAGSTEFGSTTTHSFFAKVPIQGWSSNTVSSADTDTRVIAMSASGTCAGTLNSSINIARFPTVSSQSNIAYDTSTGIGTIPVTGWYQFDATIAGSAGTATTNGYDPGVYIFRDSAQIAIKPSVAYAATTGAWFGSVATTAYFNAGQTFDVRVLTDRTGSPVYAAGSTLSVTRVSGPAVVQAVGAITACYTTLPNTTITSGTAVRGTVKVTDSHNVYNTTTGGYPAPVTGTYRCGLTSLYTTSQSNWSLYVNGVSRLANIGNTFNAGFRSAFWGEVTVNAGDIITWVPDSTVTAGATDAIFTFTRIVGIG